MKNLLNLTLADKWRTSWGYNSFKQWLFVGIVVITTILIFLPAFFHNIEQRQGISLNDEILNRLTPHNVSIPIFTILWGLAFLMLVRAIQNPEMLLKFIWVYIFICLSRVITISLCNINPPIGLIPLIDPLGNSFYGHVFITKDLFYSGHTATIFLIYLFSKKYFEKMLALLATIIIAVLLLIQHVHYTIDVVFAPIFTYWIFVFVNKMYAILVSY